MPLVAADTYHHTSLVDMLLGFLSISSILVLSRPFDLWYIGTSIRNQHKTLSQLQLEMGAHNIMLKEPLLVHNLIYSSTHYPIPMRLLRSKEG